MQVDWDPAFETGHALIDQQHRALLDGCNALAALCSGDAPAFEAAYARWKAIARAHAEAEAALLALAGEEVMDEHRAEWEEFDVLTDEIATPAHFDRAELQSFVAVWCLGHVRGSSRLLRGAG